MQFESNEIVSITEFQYKMRENIQKAIQYGKIVVFRRNTLAFIVIPIVEGQIVKNISATLTSNEFQKNMKQSVEKLEVHKSIVVMKENAPYFIACLEDFYEECLSNIVNKTA